MASVQKPRSPNKQQKELDTFSVPCDTNKENIMVSQNLAFNTSILSLEELNFEEEVEEKVDVNEQDSEELTLSDCDSYQSSGVDTNVISRTPTKKPQFSEPEDGELCEEDTLLESKTVPREKNIRISPETSNAGSAMDNAEKLHKRAKRFGISVPVERRVSEEILLGLYKSLGIPLDKVRSGKLKTVRLDTIHMRGVEEMSTSDVYKYFTNFNPVSVEWINDVSCNVLFSSDLSAAEAMLELSREIISGEEVSKNSDRSDSEILENENEEGMSFADPKGKKAEKTCSEQKKTSLASLFDKPVPPGMWRQGQTTDNARYILLRFASKDDKKIRGAEKRSTYYKKYGNPNYGGLTGLITSSRKRKYASLTSSREEWDYSCVESGSQDFFDNLDSPDDDENTLSAGGKKIKMRMYADAVKGVWQRISSPKQKLGTPPNSEPYDQAKSDSAEDEKLNYVKDDIPSRFKIWNPIAESMAKEAELAEQSQQYRSGSRSLLQNDLRSKISVPSSSQSFRHVSKKNTDVSDLRKKLQKMRRGGPKTSDRFPLLIRVRNGHDNDSDSSF